MIRIKLAEALASKLGTLASGDTKVIVDGPIDCRELADYVLAVLGELDALSLDARAELVRDLARDERDDRRDKRLQSWLTR